MDANQFLNYIEENLLFFLFLIVFLEYLNLPAFPAGIIMPLAGYFIADTNSSFTIGFLVSVVAGLLASWLMYYVGYFAGNLILERYMKRFPKQKDYILDRIEYLRSKGNIGVFICKIIPVARTIIPIPAGIIKMDFIQYTIYTFLGILIWNFALMYLGYLLGDKIIPYLF